MEFKKTKITGISGEPEMHYVEKSSHEASPLQAFRIIALPSGIQFEGNSPVIQTRTQLDKYAKIIGDAWTEHEKMKPKIVTTLAGH